MIGGLEGAVRLELQDVVKAIPDAERLQAINKMDITSTIDEKSANVSFLNPDNSSGTMFYEEYMLESNATNNNEDVDSSKRVISDEDEEEIVDPRLRRKLEKKKKNQERREKSEKRKKKKHRENKIPEEDQEKTDPSASALTQPLIETHLSPIPSGCYNTTAPEVLLGGQASLQSTVYVVGTLLAYLLIGQPVIKVRLSLLYYFC